MNELAEIFIWSYIAGIVTGVGLVIITLLILDKEKKIEST
tara:strand:- start:913 stop:1032 length:120 start_codon:yes stop_codon:yes gene_type:complete